MTTEVADGDWGSPSTPSSVPDGDLGSSAREDPGSPNWMLWLAAASVVASLAMFVAGSELAPNIAGYVLGSVVAFTLVALFSRASRVRLFKAGIGTGRGLNRAAVGLLAVGLLSVALHAYLIARHYS